MKIKKNTVVIVNNVQMLGEWNVSTKGIKLHGQAAVKLRNTFRSSAHFGLSALGEITCSIKPSH